MSPQREQELKQLSEQLGYEFNDLGLLDLALSHSSWSNEQQSQDDPALACNERLEFLGDSVLGLVISHYLYISFPHAPEGELSRMRANLVNTHALSECAKSLNVGQYLMLGKGEEQQEGREKTSILADALEAILASIYLDGGMKAAGAMIRRVFKDRVEDSLESVSHKDHKSILQEKIQAIMPSHPQYKLLDSSGPDHHKMFQVAVVLQGKTLATGQGRSKKQAEQEAARHGLENFDALHIEEQD